MLLLGASRMDKLLVRPPVLTPWGDYNVRLQDPDGMQVTLFQVSEKNE